ncbi:unnamed protein product [Urochloa humidicola]
MSSVLNIGSGDPSKEKLLEVVMALDIVL